jgi:peptidylprolyl isomerase
VPFGPRRVAVCLLAPALLLVACSSGSSHPSSSSPPSGGSNSVSAPAAPTVTTTAAVGITVGGGFGSTPTITVPASAAPAGLTQQVLSTGKGAPLAKGDLLVANYVGQTWAPKSGKVNVFDSSFARSQAAGFVIGEGQVIAGWDDSLVGKPIGSRVLITVPPSDGYGSAGQPSANISGTDTLVFVIDLDAAYKPDASAPGKVVPNLPTAGLPKITNVPGEEPAIESTAGVKVPTSPQSTLLVAGTGPKIDSAKVLVLQLVESDLATGTNTESSWGQAPQTDSASSVLGIADKLAGQNVGSRVVVLLPATAAVPASATQASEAAAPPEVLIVDVIGQF